jgi:glycosyltransferase involved in cell wall biosynthesis
MRIVDRFFSLPAGFLFLTPEEEALVAEHCSQPLAASCIIGAGLEPVTPGAQSRAPLDQLGIVSPFVLYLGRIDPNKGCETLLRHFLGYAGGGGRDIQLVMAGPENMPIPDHPGIRRLGFVADEVREALLSHARVVVIPSPFESLSLALLEAWNHRVPALVNGHCSVLKGQALRSGGALYYRNFDEFATGLGYLLDHPDVAEQLGDQGLAYVDREYRWPRVMQSLEDFLVSLDGYSGTKSSATCSG